MTAPFPETACRQGRSARLIFRRGRGNAAAMAVLTGHARVAGIIGWPVSHSRSPRLHGYWLEKHGIDGAYIPLPIAPEHFRDTVRGLMHAGFAGANVTIPHKLAAFEVCDTVDETARAAGAVNTLTFRDGKITGANTDGWGFLANLRAHGVDPRAGPALLLGRRRRGQGDRGGAARRRGQGHDRQPHRRPRRTN